MLFRSGRRNDLAQATIFLHSSPYHSSPACRPLCSIFRFVRVPQSWVRHVPSNGSRRRRPNWHLTTRKRTWPPPRASFPLFPPRSLEKRASQALLSHVDLPPERGSDGPSTVNICHAPVSPSIVMLTGVIFPVLSWVARPARLWAPLRGPFCRNTLCMISR